MNNAKTEKTCAAAGKCGGCTYLHESYEKQLEKKENEVKKALSGVCRVNPIAGMQEPWHYRNKVHAVFSRLGKKVITGSYREDSHQVVPVENCLLEDEQAGKIIRDIRDLAESFRLQIYDEDRETGLLRHVLIRRGFATGQVLVVLVAASPVFPSKKNFTAALLKLHPEVTSLVLNVNDRRTSMVIGKRNIVLYGKGWIEDELLGKRFRISPASFYQVNPVMTQRLYRKAEELAGLTGKETVIDAYCGIGTIGLCAGEKAARLIGVELNPDAVADAKINARRNGCEKASFFCDDAGKWMSRAAQRGEGADVVFMDPPRSGSTPEFIRAVAGLGPSRVVYISCCPETLARDLRLFKQAGYRCEEAWPFDMFPWTKAEHVETVVRLDRVNQERSLK